MLALIRRLYHRRAVEGLSIIWGEPEWELDANPFVQRYYSEYSLTARPATPSSPWLDRAIRRIVVEEKPDILVVPNGEDHYCKAVALVKDRAGRSLLWPDTGGQDLGRLQADAAGLNGEHEVALLASGCKPLLDWQSLDAWLQEEPPKVAARPKSRLDEETLLDRIWPRLLEHLPENVSCPKRPIPCSDPPVAQLHLFELARAKDPVKILHQSLEQFEKAFFLEPVNLPLRPDDHTFRYREYDNEFATVGADYDLYQLCRGLHSQATILNPGSGCAEGDGPLDAPDGPRFLLLQLSRAPIPSKPWWDSYQLPAHKKLNIVLADSMNMAGSLANHCLTINRYTQHNAVGLCTEEHPWISYPQKECCLKHLTANPDSKTLKTLEEADGFIFFEDDDETSPSWPFDLRPYVLGKPIVHVYIGYRIHKKVAEMQRPGRTVLTPLPHIMRMVPNAKFYAGFPPASLYDVPLRPPKSTEDGVLRVLHTPSMPHRILSRFVYHKDTEAFMAASRKLKTRFPKVEFLQLGGLPHRQILEARQLCDISLNHLRGYISLSGDEALYFKRPLVHAFNRFSINRHKEYWGLDTPFPWLTATPQTLADVFERLIGDKELRQKLGEAGHQFIKDYFAPEIGILPLIWHLSQAPAAKE